MGETWKPVPDFEELYAVSDLGRVMRTAPSRNGQKGGNILRPRRAKKTGYLQVCLSRDGADKWFYLHVLVCTVFQGPRPVGLDCCHNDGDQLNCTNGNLRWDTKAANEADRVVHGTHNRGQRHGMSKLLNDEVRTVRRELEAGRSKSSLARQFDVSLTCICQIANGERWATTI